MENSSKTGQISCFWAVFDHILACALNIFAIGAHLGHIWGTKRAQHIYIKSNLAQRPHGRIGSDEKLLNSLKSFYLFSKEMASVNMQSWRWLT